MSNPITDLLDILHKENLTAISNELETALKILVDSINNIEPAIQKELRKSIDNKDYDKVQTLSQIPDKSKECVDYINGLLNEKPIDISSNKTSQFFSNKINQNDKHTLLDDNSGTRPYHIILEGKDYDLERNNWKYFIYRLLDILYIRDKKLFEQFRKGIENKGLQKYLTFSTIPIDKAHLITGSNIYVKYISGALSAKNYAQALLNQYNIDINHLIIYWENKKENDPNEDDEDSGG